MDKPLTESGYRLLAVIRRAGAAGHPVRTLDLDDLSALKRAGLVRVDEYCLPSGPAVAFPLTKPEPGEG